MTAPLVCQEHIAWRDAEIERLRASNQRQHLYIAELELVLIEAGIPIPQNVDTRPEDPA